MSYDVNLIKPPCVTCGHGGEIETDFSFTYNYSPALAALPNPFSIKDLHNKSGAQAVTILERALLALQKEPEYYDKLIRGGGTWGKIELLIQHLTELRDACNENPECYLSVS